MVCISVKWMKYDTLQTDMFVISWVFQIQTKPLGLLLRL